jgi:hypothetical protein
MEALLSSTIRKSFNPPPVPALQTGLPYTGSRACKSSRTLGGPLATGWNKEHSDHQFASWRHFRTSFERADKAV